MPASSVIQGIKDEELLKGEGDSGGNHTVSSQKQFGGQ